MRGREGRRRVPALACSLARPAAASCTTKGKLLTERRGFGGESEREGGKESGTRLLVRWQRSPARPVAALACSPGGSARPLVREMSPVAGWEMTAA
jgi:hypothetical protein